MEKFIIEGNSHEKVKCGSIDTAVEYIRQRVNETFVAYKDSSSSNNVDIDAVIKQIKGKVNCTLREK